MFSKNKNVPAPLFETDPNQQKQEQSPPSPTFGTKNVEIPIAGKVGKSHHEYMKVMNAHTPTQTDRPITKQQLSKHNKLQSAWLSLNGVVYDVTVYIRFHPGGVILLEGCGKQCIDLFNEHHPWVNGKHLLSKYQLGFLKG